MKLAFSVPGTFLDQTGFVRSVRQALQTAPDPEVAKIFEQLGAPIHASTFIKPSSYCPPRWIGYWSSQQIIWASDGILKLIPPHQGVLQVFFEQLRASCFYQRSAVPFITSKLSPPRHMLLHDTVRGELHIESFEQAEAILCSQPRGNSCG